MKPDSSHRLILLVHGFAANRRWMSALERKFARSGYRTSNWGYPSFFQSIETHAVRLSEQLEKFDQNDEIERFDLVTHSMGCIVVRAALQHIRPKKLGRWVMLAPPNRGSRIATLFSPLVGRWLQPVAQLRDEPDSYVCQLPVPPDVEIGIVEATWDWMVRSASTHLDQEQDHLTVSGLHSTILFRKCVADQCLHFLEQGHFEKQCQPCLA